MRLHLVLVPGVLLGCQPSAPSETAGAAEAQAQLATDSTQARLWSERAGGAAGIDLERLAVDSLVVRSPTPALAPGISEQVIPTQAFPESVVDAVVVHSAPEDVVPFDGRATVTEVTGDFVTLDVGAGELLRIQARVGGRSLRLSPGEAAELSFRQGDPTARDDVLSLRTEGEDFVYALVGSLEPVRITIENRGLVAAQVGSPDGNTMSVDVTLGRETQRLTPGAEAAFGGGLTVKVLASVAVQGQAANVLPGRPYRLELVAWRSGG